MVIFSGVWGPSFRAIKVFEAVLEVYFAPCGGGLARARHAITLYRAGYRLEIRFSM